MAYVVYLESNIKSKLSNTPVLVEGYDNLGCKHWFYIGPQNWSLNDYKIPEITYNGSDLYISTESDSVIDESRFSILHTKLQESSNNSYVAGDTADLADLTKILNNSGIDKISGTSSHIIYTLFTDPGGYSNYGWTNIEPYYKNGGYTLNNMGPSNLYPGMNLFIISDSKQEKLEWTSIMGGIYEQIIRGLSSSGNWEELTTSEYGSLFKLRSGFGFPEVRINNDITLRFSNMSLDKSMRRDFILLRIKKMIYDLAILILRDSINGVSSSLNRYVDLRNYNVLFENAGIKE